MIPPHIHSWSPYLSATNTRLPLLHVSTTSSLLGLGLENPYLECREEHLFAVKKESSIQFEIGRLQIVNPS